jgi:hypothetical protein
LSEPRPRRKPNFIDYDPETTKLIADLERQAEEDRAAIRALMEHIRRLLTGMGPNSNESTDAWIAHAHAIARAERTSHG